MSRAKTDPAAEFKDIGFFAAGPRAVMSKPGPLEATKKFIREVQDELNLSDDQARTAADWILNKMERYAALSARPVFDDDGNGPQCSHCGTIWPLCGHHHMSAEAAEPTIPGRRPATEEGQP